MTSDSRQILINAKVAKLLLKTRKVKNQKPYLIEAFIAKINNQEGIKPQSHIYVEQGSKNVSH